MILRGAFLLLLLTVVAGGLIQGRTHALYTDSQAVPSNAFTTANCFTTCWYLHNNPSPPTGGTVSQAVLPLNGSFPSASTLNNYDTDRDGDEGLLIAKGGSGPTESDSGKMQVWRTAALGGGLSLVGTAEANVWAAVKSYGQGKAGEVFVYLRDYNGSTYTEIGNGSVYRADWQGGSSTFVQGIITIPGLNYTIPAGNMLEVKILVGGNAGDDMWLAYDTVSFSSEVDTP